MCMCECECVCACVCVDDHALQSPEEGPKDVLEGPSNALQPNGI